MNTKRISVKLVVYLVIIVALASTLSVILFVNAQTNTQTFTPTADTYVDESTPNTNYGTSTTLRTDHLPIRHSYLRFVVTGLNGSPIQSATIRLYANSSNSIGYTVKSLSNNTWTETGITYNNAPAPGSEVGTSPAVVAGQWMALDISSYVKAPGTYNLVIATPNSTIESSYASRETGADAPQLVVVYGSSAATATKTPTKKATSTKTPTPTKAAATPTPSGGLTPVNLTKGPDLIYTGLNTSMEVFWQWTATTSFRVDWGADTTYALGSSPVSAYDTTNHLYKYTITGLTAATKYDYRVVVGSQYSNGTFFTSPSTSATALKFVSYGDTRTNPTKHDAIAAQVISLYQSDPGYQTLLPFTGDAVSDGDTDSDWTSQFFSPSFTHIRTELANVALAPVMGNHEGSGGLFALYFPEPFVAGRYYSFDYGPAHFTMIDQYTSYTVGSAQYNWIKSDLAASTKTWNIAVFHEPGWSANGGHPDNTTVQTVLEPLFEQYKVALVLNGHNHYYARAMVNGIPELTLGSGGAPGYTPLSGQPDIVYTYKGLGYVRVSISGSTLTGWFVDNSNTIRDTFTVTR